MSDAHALGQVTLRRDGPVAYVTFDRPNARNAMTWSMYEQLDEIAQGLTKDNELRAVMMRGAGGKAFVAGSDISQFLEFDGAEDGIAYEQKMDRYLSNLLAVPVPVLGVFEGWAVGGGLNIAAACDIRIATHETRFGVPIARTLGNCLSMQSYARIVAGFGEGRAKRMLLLGEMIDADEALTAGFLARAVDPEELDATAGDILERLLRNAPVTMAVSKVAIRRVLSGAPGNGEDLVSKAYGSADFKTGVKAFTQKKKPDWQGR